MPSPESPAKRITARSITSRLVFVDGGTSASVDISWPKPPLSSNSPLGVWLEFGMMLRGEDDFGSQKLHGLNGPDKTVCGFRFNFRNPGEIDHDGARAVRVHGIEKLVAQLCGT